MHTTKHRPQHLDEMVGQEPIKRKARIAIQAALQRGEPLPHTLLTSTGGGLGKTSFAQILANEMFSPLVMTTGQCLVSPSDLRRIIVSLEQNSVLLVDEFQNVGRAAAEELLLVLEDRILNINVGSNCAPLRIEVPPFTLIAASTEPESISPPLQQRFGLTFCFDFYAEMEIKQIIRDTFTRWSIEIDDDAALTLAQRARGIPRVALRLSERVRDVGQAKGSPRISFEMVQLTMRIEGIDSLGLSRHEQHLLRVLKDAEPRAVSARSLALALGVGVNTTIGVLEPGLVRLGLMNIGAGGRRLTEKGMQHLRDASTTEVV